MPSFFGFRRFDSKHISEEVEKVKWDDVVGIVTEGKKCLLVATTCRGEEYILANTLECYRQGLEKYVDGFQKSDSGVIVNLKHASEYDQKYNVVKFAYGGKEKVYTVARKYVKTICEKFNLYSDKKV